MFSTGSGLISSLGRLFLTMLISATISSTDNETFSFKIIKIVLDSVTSKYLSKDLLRSSKSRAGSSMNLASTRSSNLSEISKTLPRGRLLRRNNSTKIITVTKTRKAKKRASLTLLIMDSNTISAITGRISCNERNACSEWGTKIRTR